MSLDEQLNSDEDQKVLDVLDQFLQDREAGFQPIIDDVIKKHPDIADRLRECLPGIEAMENFAATTKNDLDDRSSKYPEFSDYRILGELGRGGMGIVYRAEQISLPRPVALKVLPMAAVFNEQNLQRFKNESLATAQLSHSNIISVYSVGCENGTYYYAMQLIEGQSLSELIKKLKSGHYDGDATSIATEGTNAAANSTTSSGRLSETRANDSTDTSSSRFSTGILIHNDCHSEYYVRSVARVGVQVADALSHAHVNGILHRDIKPSNLLVDQRGDVYLSDFGLARIQSDANLTMTGDIIGTLRYMSPEQAQGQQELIDHRSDVYSLGATLYELMTLEPAIQGSGRKDLLKNLFNEKVVPPSKLNSKVPFDLETVIMKSLEPVRENRYASARGFADDLERVLKNQPILARRPTLSQRSQKWLKRNPWFASTAIAFSCLFLIGLTISLILILKQLNRAEDAERVAQRRTFDAIVGQVQATLSTEERGHRYESIRLIDEAAQLAGELGLKRELPTLRSLTASALQLFDAGPPIFEDQNERKWPTYGVRFDPGHRYLAKLSLSNHEVNIVSVEDGETITSLKVPNRGEIFLLDFSDDSSLLPIFIRNSTLGKFVLWNWKEDRIVIEWDHSGSFCNVDFSSDGKTLAIVGGDQTVRFFDTATEKLVNVLSSERPVVDVAIHPHEELMAISWSNSRYVVVKDFNNKTHSLIGPVKEFQSSRIEWSPNGEMLAVCSERDVYLWEFENETSDNEKRNAVMDGEKLVQPIHVFEASSSAGIELAFHPDLPILMTSSWSNETFFWDLRSGKCLLSIPGYGRTFNQDGHQVGIHDSTNYIANIGFGDCYTRIIDGYDPRSRELQPVFSPDATIVAQSGTRQTMIWSADTGELLATLPVGGRASSALFRPNGDLITTGNQGAFLWPHSQVEEGTIQIGPPIQLTEFTGYGRSAISQDGNVLAICRGRSQVHIVDVRRQSLVTTTGEHNLMFDVSVSPDGSMACTSTWHGTGVRIWDTTDGSLIKELVPEKASSAGYFDPTGKWLAVCVYNKGFDFYRVKDWSFNHSIGGMTNAPRSKIVFSPDSKYAYIPASLKELRIVNVETTETEAKLPIVNGYLSTDATGTKLIAINSDYNSLLDLRKLNRHFDSIQIGLFENIAEANSHSPPVRKCNVEIVAEQQKPNSGPTTDDRISRLRKEALLHSDDSTVIRKLAIALRNNNEVEDAIGYFERVLELNDSSNALFDLVNVYLQRGETDKVSELLNQRIENSPNDIRALNKRAEVSLAANEWEAAANDYAASVAQNPKHISSTNQLARLKLLSDNAEDHRQALQLIDGLREFIPTKVSLIETQLVCYWKLKLTGDFNALHKAMNRRLNARLSYVTLMVDALFNVNENEYNDAIAVYERGIRRWVGSIESYLDKALREKLMAEFAELISEAKRSVVSIEECIDRRKEAEDLLPGIEVSKGKIHPVFYRTGGWKELFSQQGMALWKHGNVGDRMTINFENENHGRFDLYLGLIKSYDYGSVKFYWNGKPITESIDLFEISPACEELHLGSLEWDQNQNQLEIQITGKHPVSYSHFFGFDYIDVWPVTEMP